MKCKLLAVCSTVSMFYLVPMALPNVSAATKQATKQANNQSAIQIGASGQSVVELQKDLNLLGFSVGQVDGVFGPITATQVANFQRASHLPVTHVVDSATWVSIRHQVAARGQAKGSNPPPSPGRVSPGRVPKITAIRPTAIYLNHSLVAKPSAFTANGTTYMPIWYLKTTLATLGIQSTWNGKAWALSVPSTIHIDLTNVHLGTGIHSISMNGTTVARLTGIPYPDGSSPHLTEYMPIWYLQHALTRLNVQSKWNGVRWTVTPPPATPAAVYTAFTANGSTIGTYTTLKDAESAIVNLPGATIKDATGKVVFTQPQPPTVTLSVYSPAGTVIGTYQTLTDAKLALANMPGGLIKDSTNKIVYTQAIPYAAYDQTGTLLGVFSQLSQAQSTIINYPGAIVKDNLGQIVYSQATTPQYSAYTAAGSLIGTYTQLQQAEDAVVNSPAGTVRDNSGNVLYTAPDTVTFVVYAPDNTETGSYPSLSAAQGALYSQPGATVRDSVGNVLYIQPFAGVYQAYSASGVLIGVYSVLTDAEQSLALYPSGTVKDSSGKVVFTEGGSQGGTVPGGTPSGTGFSNVDLRYNAPASITANAINTYFTKYGSPLAGLGQWFMLAQSTYGVDANYLVSHAILESTWGKSPIAQGKNNIYGYGAYDSNPGVDAGRFPSLEYAILYQAWAVRHLYLNPGASLYVSPTAKGMNVNYASDPNWASSLSLLMGQLANNVGDSVSSYQQFSPTNTAPTPASSTEPVYNVNGAKGVTQPTPNYGYLPYYPAWTTGQAQMYVRTLQSGDIGSDVSTLQQALNQQANAGLSADGDFGPKTKAAVTAYQKAHALPVTGTCDYSTWSLLVQAPVNRIAANGTVTIDAIEQGLSGGLVVAWYHVANAGWVDSQYVHFTNVYRLTVANPTSPTGTTVPIYGSGGASAPVVMSMHAGDFVVASSPAPVSGFIQIQVVNPTSGQPVQGWIDASNVHLTAIQ